MIICGKINIICIMPHQFSKYLAVDLQFCGQSPPSHAFKDLVLAAVLVFSHCSTAWGTEHMAQQPCPRKGCNSPARATDPASTWLINLQQKLNYLTARKQPQGHLLAISVCSLDLWRPPFLFCIFHVELTLNLIQQLQRFICQGFNIQCKCRQHLRAQVPFISLLLL